MKDIRKMTKKEFQELEVEYNKEPFTSFIIVPVNKIHDSGWKCMKLVLLNRLQIIGTVSGWSDVIHLNGIGGYGKNIKNVGKTIPPTGWSIDCLPKSGLVRVFNTKEKLTLDDFIGSDIQIYGENDI